MAIAHEATSQRICETYAEFAGWNENSQLALTWTFLDTLGHDVRKAYLEFLKQQMEDEENVNQMEGEDAEADDEA